MKPCIDCGELVGRALRCKICTKGFDAARHAKLYHANRDKISKQRKERRLQNLERIKGIERAASKRQYDKDPERFYWRKIKRKYGLTPERYREMDAQQGGCCAICATPPNGKRLAVDHNHATGAVRALLCSECNLMIAQALERPEVLRKGASYLEKYQ